jgi:hypothetical protein
MDAKGNGLGLLIIELSGWTEENRKKTQDFWSPDQGFYL